MTIKRADALSLKELDRCCVGMGSMCVHCHSPMPESENAPRPCTTINSDEEIEELEAKMQ